MKLNYLKFTILNNLFIIVISITLLLLSINIKYLFVIYIIYQYYLYKNDKTIFILSCVICLIILITFITIKLYQSYLISNYCDYIEGKVIDITKKEYYQKITIKYKIFKVIINDYDFINIKIGDIICVSGDNLILEENHIPNGFNYKNYLYNNLYLYQIKANNISIISHKFSIYIINDYLKKYFNHFFSSTTLSVINGFVLGDTSGFDESLKENLKTNGIIHLFAISGSHIVLIVSFLEKLFSKFKNKKKIINTLLIIYLILTKFSVSITRAVLSYILKQFLLFKNIKLSSLDISSFIFIILIIINPYYMYNVGFILSFVSTFLIILISDYIKTLSSIKSIFIITLLINVFTFPIMINMNNEFNLLSVFINIFMILIVEGIIMPLSFIVAVFPILNIGYTYIISGFISLNELISDISYKLGLVIIVGNISNILIVIYYILIFSQIIVLNKRRVFKIFTFVYVIYILLLFININYTYTPIITFLDLYNGESTLIQYKNEIILIDTGEGINNEVSSFLKSKGIRKIDYLILTHNHSDHNGEAKNIIKNFSVTYIIISAYDNSEFSYYDNTIKIAKDNIIQTKHLFFFCLSPNYKSNNENNNSLVLYLNIENIKILFTGDIEEEIEKTIYCNNIDIIKISHHGSNTSSSEAYLKRLNPKYAIIMSGRNNKYEFPNIKTINTLNNLNIKTYCTKECYTITLKIKKNKCIFTYYK